LVDELEHELKKLLEVTSLIEQTKINFMSAQLSIKKPKIKFLANPLVRQTLLYLSFWTVLFLILIFIDSWLDWQDGHRAHLLFLIIFTTTFGILNWWLLKEKILTKEPVWVKTSLTVLVMLLAIFIMVLRGNLGDCFYTDLFIPSMIFFALPWFFMQAYEAHLAVPAWEFRTIEVEGLREYLGVMSFSEDDSRGVKWVFGEDFFGLEESGFYSFRTYTPKKVMEIKMDYLFKSLLAFHNYNMQPDKPLDFKDCGWEFYHFSPLFFPKGERQMNPNKTLTENGLRFQKLTAEQRKGMSDVRTDLPDNFKYTTIFIKRIRKEEPTETTTETE